MIELGRFREVCRERDTLTITFKPLVTIAYKAPIWRAHLEPAVSALRHLDHSPRVSPKVRGIGLGRCRQFCSTRGILAITSKPLFGIAHETLIRRARSELDVLANWRLLPECQMGPKWVSDRTVLI